MLGRITIFTALLVMGLSGQANDGVAPLKYSSEKLWYFPESKLFELDHEDLKLRGLEVGPEGGIPFLFAGGFTSNIPTYRKLVRALAASGFRVFIYNPPGQGSAELLSRGQSAYWQSFEGLVEAMELMQKAVYSITQRKMLVGGHSLGGMQARVFSLGLRDLADSPSVDPEKQKWIQDTVEMIVPIFSPAFEGFSFAQLHPVAEYWMQGSVQLIKNHLKYDAAWRWHMGGFAWMHALARLSLGVPSIDYAEVYEIGRLSVSESIPDEIIESFRVWGRRRRVVHPAGFDYAGAWKQQKLVRALYVIAQSDTLALPADLGSEYSVAGHSDLILRGGHIDPLWDSNRVQKIIDSLRDKLTKIPCDSWLRGS